MAKFVIRGFFSRKLRAVLTGIAIALGVSLMSGTYILTDTIDNAFSSIFSSAVKGHSVIISPVSPLGQTNRRVSSATIPASVLRTVRATPGVAVASGSITSSATLLNASGHKLGSHNFSLVTGRQPPPFNNFAAAQGMLPSTAGEVAIDEHTASTYNLHLGDTIEVAGAAPARSYKIVGIVTFAGSSSLAGAAAAMLTLPEAQRVAGEPNGYDQINVAAAPGVSDTTLQARLRAVLPASLDVRTGAQAAAQDTSNLESELSPLRTFLLVFAYVALFVGAFIIFNTFAITVAQRTREFGLLRTLGATRRQLLVSVLAEGLLLGLIGSAVGLLVGLAIAPALDALFKSVFGANLPDTGTVVKFRTVWVSLLAGTAVTLLAGLVPAIRATRVTPVAAMREGVGLEHHHQQRRPISPARRALRLVVLVLVILRGVIAVARGEVIPAIVLLVLAGGYILLFLRGQPLNWVRAIIPGLGRVIGGLVAWRGVIGRIARDNAIRQPGRTAVTAAALMIGLALVTFAAILASGLKASINQGVDRSFGGDLIIENSGFSGGGGGGASGIPATIPASLRTVPGVRLVTALAFTEGRVSGIPGNASVIAVDPSFATVYRIDWKQGSNAVLDDLDSSGTVITQAYSKAHHLHVGQALSVLTPTGAHLTLVVRGIADDTSRLLGDLTISLPLARTAFAQRTDALDFVTYVPGATNAQVQPAVDRVLAARYPQAQSQTASQFKASLENQVNGLLTFVYILLTLSVIVSLFGIVNTLVLSIYERRRELGMMRAIGTRRRQIRQLIRYESIITALIGGVLGIVLGVIIALIASASLSSTGFILSIPWGTLIILLVISGIAGVAAGAWPARRAARVDVLEAIATE